MRPRAAGFAFLPRGWDIRTNPARACSMRCLHLIARGNGVVIHLPHYEAVAIDAAGVQAGAYLDAIGKTDFAALTPDEWRHFIALIFLTATAEVRTLVERDAPAG